MTTAVNTNINAVPTWCPYRARVSGVVPHERHFVGVRRFGEFPVASYCPGYALPLPEGIDMDSDDTRLFVDEHGDIDCDEAAAQLSEPVLATFRYEHLPRGPIRECSANFAALAVSTVIDVPRSAERTQALRHIWDAKNYAVYAVSTALRGQPDDDGFEVGGERVREGSSETLLVDEVAKPVRPTECAATVNGMSVTTGASLPNHRGDDDTALHVCGYEADHAGRHRCNINVSADGRDYVECGEVW